MCKKNNIALIPSEEKIACTKKCYKKVQRILIQEVNEANVAINLSWDKDGLEGEHDPVNSMVVLLEWWTSGNNYSKYRGKDNKGKKKKDVYFKLAASINLISRCEQTANSMKCKIIGLESSWKMAHDWAGATGKGVKENEGVC